MLRSYHITKKVHKHLPLIGPLKGPVTLHQVTVCVTHMAKGPAREHDAKPPAAVALSLCFGVGCNVASRSSLIEH